MYQHLQASGVKSDRTRPPVYPTRMPPSHTLSPADQYASYLRSVYTSKKLPTYSKWPPSSSKKYVHLAVVKKERVSKREADEFTRATIHGTEIDNIYQKKEAVDFSKVGKREDGSLAKLILVEGAPGIGKTTFAWEVCRKWANGEILQEYGLVVLLRLRDKRVREVKTVFDLFHHPNSELSNAVGKEILHHEGQSVLLLYQGYDELPTVLQEQQSIFLDVLHKEYLPHAAILITSRPSATGYLHWEFREQISQHIEILGFTKDDIISFVHDVMKDEQLRRDFLQYLKCYPYIRGMMYVPLNAVIVTEVYKSSQQSPEKFIPTTMTELYTALTQSILLRYLHSHSEYGQRKWNLKSFTDLPKELYKQFCCVTRVALNGMIEDKFVFDDLPNDFNTLDLMQSVPELYVEQGALISYNFFHLTLQEYLAAVNISQQPVKKQLKFFQTASLDFNSGDEWSSSSDEESECFEDPKATAEQTTQPPGSHKASFLHVAPPHPQFPASGHHTTYQSVPKYQHQPLPPRTLPHSFMQEQFRHPPSPRESPFYLLPPSPSTPPPKRPRLNPYTQPFVPQHQYLTSDVSPSRPSSHATLSTRTPAQSTPPHQLMPSIVPPHPLPSATPLHPPHATVAPPTPRMLHPFSHTVMRPRAPEHFQQQWPHSLHHTNHVPTSRLIASAPVHCHPSFNVFPNEQLSYPHLFMPHTPVPPPPISSSYTASRLRPPPPTMAPQWSHPLREHPFSPSMSTRTSVDFRDNHTHHDTLPTLSTGQMGLSTLMSVGTNVNIISAPSTTVPLSGASSTQLSLPDINVPGISTRLRNVLRFVAGLTKFKCIPIASLQPLLLQDRWVGAEMTLKSLHWLFETQCSDMYNKMVSSSPQLTFGGRSALGIAMSPFDCFVLGYAIVHVTCHWKIHLNDTHIGDEGVEMLVAGMNFDKVNFTQSDYSVSLNLSCSDITSEGMDYLNKIPKHVITELDLANNGFGDRGAIALAEMLKESRTLQQLNISDNSIGQGGATTLAEVLKENGTLQQLNVSRNSIGPGGATALAEMLKENGTLQQLDVSGNSIGQGGATALAEMLKENGTLQQLDVGYNSIGQGGATALGEMLKENGTLQQLDVSGNSIGQGGATTLAEMLKENRSLKYLQLHHDSIGEEGTVILLESLKYNTTLKTLGLQRRWLHGPLLRPLSLAQKDRIVWV